MAYYQQKKIETAIGLLQKNTPTKTSSVLIDNITVNLGTSYILADIIDVTNIKSMSLTGYQVTTPLTGDTLCYVQVWLSDTTSPSSPYGPVATGYFVKGLLDFGTIDINSKYLKLIIFNDSTTDNTTIKIKAFMTS